jgi:hypothetical protein
MTIPEKETFSPANDRILFALGRFRFFIGINRILEETLYAGLEFVCSKVLNKYA